METLHSARWIGLSSHCTPHTGQSHLEHLQNKTIYFTQSKIITVIPDTNLGPDKEAGLWQPRQTGAVYWSGPAVIGGS